MNWKNRVKGILLAGLLAVCLAVSAAADGIGVGTVLGEGLRLRAQPGLEGEVLTSASKGQTAIVLEEADGWYKVDFGTQTGYMSAGFVELSTDVETDLGLGMVTTTGGTLNLRSGPGTENPVLASLPCRAVVSINGFTGGWYKVTYHNVSGYVSAGYITPVLDASGARLDDSLAQTGASDLGRRIVEEAMKHVGKRYVYATHGPNTFDCSGFSYYCVKQASGGAIVLSTGSVQQWTSAPGQRIYSIDQLQPGDLFFIDDPAYGGKNKLVTHVAIYAGDGMLVHASSSSTGVIVNPIKDKDRRYFVGAIRLG